MSQWSELYREFTDLPVRTSVWGGDRLEADGPLMADGTIMVKREAVERRDGSRLRKLPDAEDITRTVDYEAAERVWRQHVDNADREVWPVWQGRRDKPHKLVSRVLCVERDLSPADYFDPREGHLDRTVSLDGIYARLICWLTHPDSLWAQDNPRQAVVWKRGGEREPVAVQMPCRIPERDGLTIPMG